MSLRAIVRGIIVFLVGILASSVLAYCTYFNDIKMGGSQLIANYLPASVFGVLVIFVGIVNPILARLHKSLSLSAKELVLIIGMVLMTCFIHGRGLTVNFTNALILPHKYDRSNLAWQENKVLERTPDRMLADIEAGGDGSLEKFTEGMNEGEETLISYRKIPWEVWTRTFLFWGPILACVALAVIGLSLVVHRQWATHEHLPYPIANFARELLPAAGKATSSIFHNRLFLIGAGSVLAIHMYNYAAVWWPDYLVQLPLNFKLEAIAENIPLLSVTNPGFYLIAYYVAIIFTVIGFAYFLPSDVSLSLGIAPYIFFIVLGALQTYGIPFQAGGGLLFPTHEAFAHAGGYFAVFLVIMHTGRRYYLSVLRRVFGIPARDPVEPHAIWGGRLFFVTMTLFVIQICAVGLDWQLAILYSCGLFIIFIVVSRIVAETGTFYIHAWHFPCAIMLGMMGVKAVGPDQAIIISLLSTVLVIQSRESMMPFTTNALRIVEHAKAKLGRASLFGAVAVAVCLVVAVTMCLKIQYSYGVSDRDWWGAVYPPQLAFDVNSGIVQELESQNALEEAQALSGWARFGAIKPDNELLVCFGVAFGLAILCSMARLRWPRWPIHPVLFLVLGNYTIQKLAAPLLMGCLIKTLVNKYGGVSLYRKLKPLMIGLIAGEMVAGLLVMAIGAIYYFVTNPHTIPRPYWVFPN